MNLKKIYQFALEVKQEAHKIVWPERNETVITFFIVCAVIFFCSLFFLFSDYIIHKIIMLLLNIGK